MNMKILKAGTFGMYDVFQGMGWKNHTRVQARKTPTGIKLKHIDGNELHGIQLVMVTKEITK